MTFAYTSTKPYQTFPEYEMPCHVVREIVRDMSDRQRAAALGN